MRSWKLGNDYCGINGLHYVALGKKLKNNHTFIIAEAGINHNGKIHLAKKLVDISKKAGADAVKFQTFKAKDVISKYAKKLNYQKKNKKILSPSKKCSKDLNYLIQNLKF